MTQFLHPFLYLGVMKLIYGIAEMESLSIKDWYWPDRAQLNNLNHLFCNQRTPAAPGVSLGLLDQNMPSAWGTCITDMSRHTFLVFKGLEEHVKSVQVFHDNSFCTRSLFILLYAVEMIRYGKVISI